MKFSITLLAFTALLVPTLTFKFEAGVRLPLTFPKSFLNKSFITKYKINFAFIDATYGTTIQSNFFEYWAHLGALGLKRGVIHRYTNSYTPEQNFDTVNENILSDISLDKEQLFAVSIENNFSGSEDKNAHEFETFLQLIEKKFNIRPIIYTDKGHWTYSFEDQSGGHGFESHRLWINDTSPYVRQHPTLISIWDDYYIWQYMEYTDPSIGELPFLWKVCDEN